jgi:hypothetical protein
MPGFVKTPKDEKRWSSAKEAASKQTEPGSTGYWKLSNYIFHKMNKTEEVAVPKHKNTIKLWDFLRTAKHK